MDLQQLSDWGYTFYVQYPAFCYVAGGIFLLLVLWKPFKVLKSAFLVLVLAAVVSIAFYLLDSMNVGLEVKGKAVHRTEKAIEQ